MRRNVRHDAICYIILVKYIKLLVKRVEHCNLKALRDQFEIISDGWKVGLTHYIDVFAIHC